MQEMVFILKKLPILWGDTVPALRSPVQGQWLNPISGLPQCAEGGRGQAVMTTVCLVGHPWLWACCQKCPGGLERSWGCGLGLEARVGVGAGRFSFLPPLPTTSSNGTDEPTSPSIDLQAKHVPASAVVSSAMNSAPVLGTSPSSPTFTFAVSRHYSQDCSEYSPHSQRHPPPFAAWSPQSLLVLVPDVWPLLTGAPRGELSPALPRWEGFGEDPNL